MEDFLRQFCVGLESTKSEATILSSNANGDALCCRFGGIIYKVCVLLFSHIFPLMKVPFRQQKTYLQLFESDLKFDFDSTSHLTNSLDRYNNRGPTRDVMSKKAGEHMSLFLGPNGAENFAILENTWKYS